MAQLRRLAARILDKLAVGVSSLLEKPASTSWCPYHVVVPLEIDPTDRRVCLFAHFDRDHHIDDYVVFYLDRLKQAGVDVIFITTSRPSVAEYAKIVPLCVAVIERENIGIDFGTWRTALLAYPQVLRCRMLLWVNDSVYGPLHPLEPILNRMEHTDCDFFAITESLEVKSHYQSYFLGFKSSGLRSAGFNDFLRSIELLADKQKIIDRYEIGMKSTLEASGLRGAALITPAPGPVDNPTISSWRELLNRGGPFLKIQLLRENPRKVSIDGWAQTVRGCGYDPDLIARHLRRTKRT